jgi:PKD domain
VLNSSAGRSGIPLLRPGDVVEDVRLSHFNGERWSGPGVINRNAGVSMRPPTPSNAPQVAIGSTGNGVVVWQEPEIDGVAHIWARRIFSSTLDYVMPVSLSSLGGTAIGDDADAPSVAVSRLGQAEVVYRQAAGPGSPLPGPRIFLNTLPDGEAASGAQFVGASVVDSAVAGGRTATVGPASIDIDEQQDIRVLYDSNGTPRVIEGTGLGLSGTLSLGPPFVGSELSNVSVMNPGGGGVSAWPSADPHGSPAVAVREDFPSKAVQTALLSGGAGGTVSELSVGRSGLGDGLVGFLQGSLGNAAVVAAQVTAPPVASILTVPTKWVKPSQAVVSWVPATSADGPLGYRVVLDGRTLPTPAGSLELRINPRGLGNGRHDVQVLATDREGQATLTAPSVLLIDGAPPSVQVKRTGGGYAVRVRVSDPYSGVAVHSISVSFGDGQGVRGRAVVRHRYRRAGIYQVVVAMRDKLGNAGVVRRLVSVR